MVGRAASPLAAARGVLPCDANLFLKGAIGGKKCEYPHKLEVTYFKTKREFS